MIDWWRNLLMSLPSGLRVPTTWLLNFLLGLALALVLNYVLYRIGLPSKPFIYVAF